MSRHSSIPTQKQQQNQLPARTAAPVESETNTENLFVLLAGKTEKEVNAKVQAAVNRFFGIGIDEGSTPQRDDGYRCYYELPQNNSMAFIFAADSNDIRSEGMSYGMTIAVQVNMKEQFDKLWKFAKIHMQYDPTAKSTPAAWAYYFCWQLIDIDTTDENVWKWKSEYYGTPAPDGEEYFAFALYLADKRWGSDGEINYKKEADNITNAMLNNSSVDIHRPIIHSQKNIVTFVPFGDSYGFSDPSYHLPAFYECFALWGPEANTERWHKIAAESRNFLVRSAHPATGLHPDYASFDGTPVKSCSGNKGDGFSGNEHDTFRHDAWRVPMNIAMDAKWYASDIRMKQQVEKYHAFFTKYKGMNNVSCSLFYLNGEGGTGGESTALTATLASASMVSEHEDAAFWVNALWNVEQQSGTYRYYQQCIYLLGMLHTAGKFRTDW